MGRNMEPRLGCVVMAAGNSARFGGNKLLTDYRGRSLIQRTLDAVPDRLRQQTVVVTQYPQIRALAAGLDLTCVENHNPELGISHTICLGTRALAGHCDGILYLVSDQPLLTRQTVERLLDAFCAGPDRIIRPRAQGRWGNPCVFPASVFEELAALHGDRGGSQVIRAHPELVLGVEVPVRELLDVDTAQTLETLP